MTIRSHHPSQLDDTAPRGATTPTGRQVERGGLVLLAACIVQFLASLDLSIVNVALPEIGTALGFRGTDVTWVIHAYALGFGGLLLLGGKAADRWGHRRVLVAGLALFAAASLLGGLSPSAGLLVAARAAQGAGAAFFAPAALAALTAAFPSGAGRAKAFGAWSAMNAAGAALGVLLGGVLTEYAGWQWVMFTNVPMALLALVVACRAIPAASNRGAGRVPDVLGAIVGTAGLALLVFGILDTERAGWGSFRTLGTLSGAVVLLAAFVLIERSTRAEPILRLGLLARRNVAAANAYNLVFGATMAAAFYLVTLYLQRVLGTSPAMAGVMLLPFALAVIAGSVVAVKAGARTTRRLLMAIGALVTAAGFAWFGLIDAEGSYLADVLGPSLLTGLGFGLCLGPVVSTATAGVDVEERGMASGLLNSSRQIGAALGLAALGAAAAARTESRSGGAGTAALIPDPAALTSGYSLGLLLCAVLFLLASLIALLALPRTESALHP